MIDIKHCGVITPSRPHAEKIIDNIVKQNKDDINKYVKRLNEVFLVLNNGTRYSWIKPIEIYRGYKINSAIIDLAVDECFLTDIFPSVFVYGQKENITIFDSRFDSERKNDLKKLSRLFGIKCIDVYSLEVKNEI